MSASRSSFGNAKPMICSSRDSPTYTIDPMRNFTRSWTRCSVVRGNAEAMRRTSSTVTRFTSRTLDRAAACLRPQRHRLQLLGDALRRLWPAQQVALQDVAVEAGEHRRLLLVLDAFGDDAQAEPVRHRDRRGHEHDRVLRAGTEPVDERLVDLELVEGQAAE